MTLRCVVDGLLLPAELTERLAVIAYDGLESFELEAVEAIYYELVEATGEELLGLQRACFRLLRYAADFELIECG